MSKERELLKRTMGFLECFVFYSEGLELREAIRDFLSTPEPTQDSVIADYATSEPVGGSKMELTTESTQDEEPVASRLADELHYAQEIIFEGCGYKLISPEDADEIVAELRRLHPAPRPEFVRLSEEEIMDLSRAESESFRWPSSAISIARAIEDALKEKNRG